ncbi:MAG: penicillin-binding protein 1C [Bdellovibrionota bacterium]
MRYAHGLRKLSRIALWGFGALALGWSALGLVPAPTLSEGPAGSKALFDSRGDLLSLSISGDERYRLTIPYREVSPAMVRAALLYEDKHFFGHFGVNPLSLVRGAAMTLLSPHQPIGGSTITMQVARMRLGLNTRSILGKLNQIFWALVLERHYSKTEILEAYFNLAPYGANIEGVGAASLVYFRKPASRLTQSEAVTLAVIPQNPSLRWKRAGRKDLDEARDILAARFSGKGEGKLIPKDFAYSPADIPSHAPHFLNRMEKLYPQRNEFASTLDADLQRDSEEVLQQTLASFSDLGVRNGTILIAELPEMKVRAYVGSASYLNHDINGFVNGLEAQRSPGSVLKPFIYGLALDQGLILPETMLRDVPIRLSSYVPENFEHNFLGPIPASDALVRSRNIPALELFRTLAPGSFYHFLNDGGVSRMKSEEYYGIALVLGGLGTTSEEIAQLYGILGSGGVMRPLEFLADEPPPPEGRRLLSKEAAYIVLDMLSKNPPALGKFRQQHIPWKTGTSYGSRDAWSVGLVGNYIVSVWLGEFDGKPNPNLVGRDLAGPVFFSVVDRLRSRGILPTTPSARGLNLKKVEVCALSGALPGPDCPHRKQSWFIPGVSPIKTCDIHRKVQVDPQSGLRMCPGEHGGEDKVFEFWESNMQKVFVQAGLRRALPPPYEQRCGMAATDSGDIRIISPEQHVEYRLEPHRGLELELSASVPADAKQLFWFADDVLIGQVAPTLSLHWQAKVGHFLFRAVDDRGRSASVNVRVLPQVGDDATDFTPPA